MSKRLIRFVANQHYHLARMYLRWGFLLFNPRGDQPIVVYQMGKVGSSTIVASLKALSLNKPIYHIHSLTPARIEKAKRVYAKMFESGADMNLRRANHLLVGQQLRKRMAKGMAAQDWKVISLVRDPIAINVSGFFQIIDHYLPNFIHRHKAGAVSIDDAIQVFLGEYDHEEPLRWFDVELKSTLGIDVFATPFPRSKGYEIYRSEHVEVLVLRLEDMNKSAGQAFKEFLNIERFNLVNANVADDKSYNAAYREFKASIRFSRSYLEKIYASKHARHFYAKDEIDAFRAKWLHDGR